MSTTGRPTSFDIAALAGVSQPTVSRALRGDRTVREATRLRIQAIARQLDYKVDKRASSLRAGQTDTIALLFFEDSGDDRSTINPFFLSMLGSILQTASRRGCDLLASFQQESSDWHVDYEGSRRADGIILLGYGDFERFRWRLDELAKRGTHFVRWGMVDAAGADHDTIGCDNREGGRLAARHLIASGRRRIAFLGDATPHYPEFRERFLGLTEVLKAAGIGIDPALSIPALTIDDNGYAAARALLDRGCAFDAIFAASDMIALAAMRALGDAGVVVPDDIAIIGFDDIPAAGLARPALTTLAQDFRQAGELLVDGLLARIAGEPIPQKVLVPRLILRESA